MATSATAPATSRWPHHVESALLAVLFWMLGAALFFLIAEDLYPDLENIPPRDEALLGIDTLLGLVGCLLVPLVRSRRRRVAGGAALVLMLFSAVSMWVFAPVVHALVTVSSWRDRRWLVVVDVVAIVAGLVSLEVMPGSSFTLGQASGMVVMVVVLNLWGLYRGQKAALADSYRVQAETLRREQAATVAMARAEERTAIAREMHDTLSHRLAVISLHAGGLSVRPDLPVERITETASLIQATAQSASEELRDLLTLLREDTADRALPTTLADLDAILAGGRAAGLRVACDVDPTVRARLAELPVGRSAALAQTVREGLANCLKHAPDQPVAVAITADQSGATVLVCNPLSRRDTGLAGGHGLVGLDERLRLARGRLRHGVVSGNHELEAWVPWT
ncbi:MULTISPECIES: sensor histidine kinase [unclassified Luteococcus]|uniref:sensor histidine kinase n=1 Tax=unclassified Luteococcus TaxID=2639923 RepID=UPI00313A801F